MNLSSRIEQELSSFILFGGLMDERSRRFTAEQLFFHLHDPRHPIRLKLTQSDLPERYPNWYQMLVRLVEEEELKRLTINNEDFAFSVTREALEWCRKTYQQFQHEHNFQQEEGQLDHLKKHLSEAKTGQWSDALSSLQQWYPRHAQSWQFYADAIRKQEAQEDSPRLKATTAVVKQQVLRDWGGFLGQKKQAEEGVFLEETFTSYFAELRQKVEQLSELGDLLAPFYNFLGQVWNDSLGNWDKIQWDKLEEFAQQMTQDRYLRELVDMLGRWQHARHLRQERLMQRPLPKESWKPNPYGKSEIVGVQYSDHISALLPSEVALLASPETEILLSKKYVEKKLLTFQYRSQDLSVEESVEEIPLVETDWDQPGPFILCIDTSGSMFGIPERIAKSVALAILEIALRQHRQAFLISFSTGIQTTKMTGMEKDLSQLIDFIRMSFHGGTDLQPALSAALDQLETEQYRNADILVISDFVIPRLDRKLYERIQVARRELSTHIHSLHIARRPDPDATPLAIFDHHWVYDMDHSRVIRQTVAHLAAFEPDHDEATASDEF
ncbi:MAG: VWA domain-containing protein [Bacteroidota bacterium]